MKYVLIDKENERAHGPFDSEYDAGVFAIDQMKTYGEITRTEAFKLLADVNRNGVEYRYYGNSGRLDQSWDVLELNEVDDKLVEVK